MTKSFNCFSPALTFFGSYLTVSHALLCCAVPAGTGLLCAAYGSEGGARAWPSPVQVGWGDEGACMCIALVLGEGNRLWLGQVWVGHEMLIAEMCCVGWITCICEYCLNQYHCKRACNSAYVTAPSYYFACPFSVQKGIGLVPNSCLHSPLQPVP